MRVIGFAGWSGAGKTTLIVRLITFFHAQNLNVSTLKHAHHSFDLDQPGKDSYAHRQAGAREVLIASGRRWALLHELEGEPEPCLSAHLERLSPADFVLIEGFKREPHLKLEVHRKANAKPWLYPGDETIAGVVSDAPLENPAQLPHAALDDIPSIAGLVFQFAEPIAKTLQRLHSVC